MSQRVPNWDVNDDAANATLPRLSFIGAAAAAAAPTPPRPDLSSVDYEVAELTWENGQLSMHGLGHSRLNTKPPAAVGTLESLVNQATSVVDDVVPPAGRKPSFATADLAPWFDLSVAPTDVIATASTTMTMDVLVPCTAATANDPHQHALWLLAESVTNGTGVCGCCSTRVGSCSAMGGGNGEMNPVEEEQRQEGGRKRTHRGGGVEWGDHQSVSGSGVYNSHHITTQDTYEREPELENVASQGSTEDTSYRKGGGGRATATTTTEEHDSVHSHPQREAEEKRRLGKSSLSTKRNRAAAIHNQSERKRRDKINQRMKTLQKLVPNSSKMDKASVLDEAIDYLKQLQAQVQMMSRMNMPVPPPMMLPLAMQQQQQLQLSMMAPMGLGLGLPGMPNVMAGDITGLSGNRPNIPGIPPATAVLQPFMPMAVPWNGSPGDRFSSGPTAAGSPDPLSAFLVSQSPPGMTLEAYTRLAAMYQQQMRPRQQQQQPPQPSNPNN